MPRGRPRKNPTDVLIKSAEFIGWALGGIEREILETRHRLSALTAQANQLRARIGAKGARARPAAAPPLEAALPSAPAAPKRRRRKMSPEARKRMSELMKKRWAERRKKT
jgi:hypothetical protein